MNEYCWVLLRDQVHYRRLWRLAPNPYSPANLGMIAESYTGAGWHILPYTYAPPVATLPQTMGRDEVKAIAKTILLSLKESA